MNDLLLDENFDITNSIGEATNQSIGILLLTNKGTVKSAPQVGVNLTNYIKSSTSNTKVEIAIKKELELDGAIVRSVSLENNDIKIDAKWD